MKLKQLYLLASLLLLPVGASHAASLCQGAGVWLQVLGSGGPEITDQRASSGYLIWHDGKARVLVDIGPGSMLRFEQSGAQLEDLDLILLTHLHVDHSGDLPGLVKAAFFSERTRDLPIYGPTGNARMPDTVAFVQALFATPAGAYRYLGDFLSGEAAFRLIPTNVSAEIQSVQALIATSIFKVSAVSVQHGAIPALAWRIDIAGRAIAFSGDTNGESQNLTQLAQGVDLLVAHNAVPQAAQGVERKLHMPPSVIGKIAADAKVKQLVLSHRMRRTLGREAETRREIRTHYAGQMAFADDGQCFRIGLRK